VEIYYVYLFFAVDVRYIRGKKNDIIDFDLFFEGLRRNSYTQYLIALAIVDTGAIFAEGISTKILSYYLIDYF